MVAAFQRSIVTSRFLNSFSPALPVQRNFSHSVQKISIKNAIRKGLVPDLSLSKQFKDRCMPQINYSTRVLCKFPELLHRYQRVAQTLATQGQYPIVHGQSCLWAIPQTILKSLGYEGLRLIRFPNEDLLQIGDEMHTAVCDKIIAMRASKYISANIKLPRDPDHDYYGDALDHRHRDVLLAGTIGICHGEPYESPASFIFGAEDPPYSARPLKKLGSSNRNILDDDRCIEKANFMISNALRIRNSPRLRCINAGRMGRSSDNEKLSVRHTLGHVINRH